MTIDGSAYSGTAENCPMGMEVAQSTSITWASDGSNEGAGWQICGANDEATSDGGCGGGIGGFTVLSGPCTASGSCVGRPAGYDDNESCEIVPTGSFTLSSCQIFDTEQNFVS